MAKVYDIVASGGEYTDRDGNSKTRWINCGSVFEKNGKLSMKFDAYAIGDGWYNLFEPRAKQAPKGESGTRANSVPQDDDFSDPIPF